MAVPDYLWYRLLNRHLAFATRQPVYQMSHALLTLSAGRCAAEGLVGYKDGEQSTCK